MMRNITVPLIVLFSFGLVAGCVSQSKHEAVVKERDQLAKQNRALKTNMKLTRNEKEAMKENLDTTTEVLAATSDELAATKTKAMTSAVLYDKLVNQLSSELSSQKVTIEQMQNGVNVSLPESILFESGSANVKKSGEIVLHKVAKELWDVPYQTIVGGFTDNVPISSSLKLKFPSNWDLAASRATNVVRMLEDSGVPKKRLVAVSFGENQPVASNDSPQGRALNRRIEIRIRPVVIEEK